MTQSKSIRFMAVKLLKIVCIVSTLLMLCLPWHSSRSADSAIVEMCPYSLSITEADIAHGREQVEKFLKDRPRAAPLLRRRQAVYNWIVRQFAGEYVGSRIFWRDSNFLSSDENFLSSYTLGAPGQPPTVTVLKTTNDGRLLDGELICARVIFELFNVRNGKAFNQAKLAAKTRKLTKSDFVLEIARLEYEAEQHTVHFYDSYWARPKPEPKASTFRQSYWYKPLPPNFEVWISQFSNKAAYPWSTYGIKYDLLMNR